LSKAVESPVVKFLRRSVGLKRAINADHGPLGLGD
jgi:hypothetical protein